MNCPHCQNPLPDDARFCAACGKATSATEQVTPGAAPGGAPIVDPIGKEIAGRYRILAKLGEGGMGAVYRAEQISLKRVCAVKLLRPDLAGTPIMLRRFNAEAEAIAKLSHPNIVNIYDFGQDSDGSLFIAMEFVEGASLRKVVQTEAPLAPARALAIAAQVAASLVEAHAQNVIHRDLKPDNVMLQTRGRTRDVVRVLDFGIAKLRDEGRATQMAMTQAGDMLGTPQYMAPEQIRAEPIDGRVDVYALGCMLYEMLTARLPFEAPTLMALLSKHLMETPLPPSQRRPELGLPPAIDELVMTALAKQREARPPTMEAYAERIQAVLATLPADPTATGSRSAVVGVPGAPGLVTPPASYAAAPTPSSAPGYPPAGFTPPPPPPGTPAPVGFAAPPTAGPPTGPAGYPVAAPGYGAPPSGYAPYPGGPPGAAPAGARGGSGMLLLIIALVVLVGGGAAAAIYFATRSSDDAPQVAEGGGDAGAEAEADAEAGSGSGSGEQDGKLEAEDPDLDHGSDPDDPWGGAGTASGDAVARLEAIKAEMCACRDPACVVRVTGELQAWSRLAATAATDPATVQKLADLTREVSECSLRAASARTPPRPPPRPAGDLNDQLDRIADHACACDDAACGRKVVAEMIAFARAHRGDDEGDYERGKRAGERMAKCLLAAGVPQDELVAAFQSLTP